MKAKTHFEQVPVEVVKRIAQKDNSPLPAFCAICGDEVALEQCKIDETGDPVHESCYVSRLQVPKAAGARKNSQPRKLLPQLGHKKAKFSARP